MPSRRWLDLWLVHEPLTYAPRVTFLTRHCILCDIYLHLSKFYMVRLIISLFPTISPWKIILERLIKRVSNNVFVEKNGIQETILKPYLTSYKPSCIDVKFVWELIKSEVKFQVHNHPLYYSFWDFWEKSKNLHSVYEIWVVLGDLVSS